MGANRSEPKPRYSFWGGETEYISTDAAFLCCDREPWTPTGDNPLPADVRAMERTLLAEVPFRDTSQIWLTVHRDRPAPHKPGPKLFKRDDLREWAERTGRRAPFLFPEDRASSETKDPATLSTREETACLKILAAIIEKAYGPGTIEDLKKQRSDKFGIILREVAKHFEMNETTIRKYLKKLPDLPS